MNIIDLFTETTAVANVSALIAVGVYIAREIGSTWLRKKLNIKDVQIKELENKIIEQDNTIRELNNGVKIMSAATKHLSSMMYTGLINSKLPAESKNLIAKEWSAVDNLLEDVSVVAGDALQDFAEEGSKKIFEKVHELVEDNEILKAGVEAVEEFVDEAIDEIPNFIKETLSDG